MLTEMLPGFRGLVLRGIVLASSQGTIGTLPLLPSLDLGFDLSCSGTFWMLLLTLAVLGTLTPCFPAPGRDLFLDLGHLFLFRLVFNTRQTLTRQIRSYEMRPPG